MLGAVPLQIEVADGVALAIGIEFTVTVWTAEVTGQL